MKQLTLLLASLFTATWLFTIVSSQPVHGDQPNQNKNNAAQPANRLQHKFLGPQRCQLCHRGGEASAKIFGGTKFIQFVENDVWSQKDKHAKAFELIDPTKSKLSKQICDKLGIDVKKFQDAQQCLSCHSNWLKGKPRPPHYALGVTCESCHGASSNWDVPHSKPEWRKKSPGDKEKLGLIDVRSPLRRAEQCYSCHIGNKAEGKVVTHEMYAAGHPPLPSIELETFMNNMPPHWMPASQKPNFKFKAEFLKQNYGVDKLTKQAERTRSVMVGALVALRESIELIRDESKSRESWPELASFDCYSCHHDLRYPSWRQTRGYRGRPGRPQIRFWATALAPVAIDLAAGGQAADVRKLNSEFNSALWGIQRVLDDRPFGEPVALQTASKTMIDWTDRLLQRCQKQVVDQQAAHRALRQLCRIGSTTLPDYDSARQLLWAFRQVHADLDQNTPQAAAIKARLDRVSGMLQLQLPSGQKRSILGQLPTVMKALSDYDPAKVKGEFEALRKLLK